MEALSLSAPPQTALASVHHPPPFFRPQTALRLSHSNLATTTLSRNLSLSTFTPTLFPIPIPVRSHCHPHPAAPLRSSSSANSRSLSAPHRGHSLSMRSVWYGWLRVLQRRGRLEVCGGWEVGAKGDWQARQRAMTEGPRRECPQVVKR